LATHALSPPWVCRSAGATPTSSTCKLTPLRGGGRCWFFASGERGGGCPAVAIRPCVALVFLMFLCRPCRRVHPSFPRPPPPFRGRSDPYRISDYDLEITLVEARDLKDVTR
jgi:hypothetical protein